MISKTCSRGLLPGCIHLLNKADQTRDIENVGSKESKAKATPSKNVQNFIVLSY
jgi:hypothetical protein